MFEPTAASPLWARRDEAGGAAPRSLLRTGRAENARVANG